MLLGNKAGHRTVHLWGKGVWGQEGGCGVGEGGYGAWEGGMG